MLEIKLSVTQSHCNLIERHKKEKLIVTEKLLFEMLHISIARENAGSFDYLSAEPLYIV